MLALVPDVQIHCLLPPFSAIDYEARNIKHGFMTHWHSYMINKHKYAQRAHEKYV
jgi:hypothetical protein